MMLEDSGYYSGRKIRAKELGIDVVDVLKLEHEEQRRSGRG